MSGNGGGGSTHGENLARVRGNIMSAILAFLRERLAGQPEFTAGELRAYVTRVRGVAPASPDRILRDGRQRGLFDYVLVSRKMSRYRVTRLGEEV